MKTPVLHDAVARALIRGKFVGLLGYNPEADSLFVDALQEFVLSKEHAEYALSIFDHECPTPREIKDRCWNTRAEFLPPELDEKEKWLAEGATYDPDWSANLLKGVAQEDQFFQLRVESVRLAIYYTDGRGVYDLLDIKDAKQRRGDQQYWQESRDRHLRDHPELVAWVRGGEVGPPPTDAPKPKVTVIKKPVTQADVDELIQKRKEQT